MRERLAALGSLYLALRIVCFENYGRIAAALWWVTILLIAFIFALWHWGAGVGAIICCVLLFRPYMRAMYRYRRRLIRKGDRVEYAPALETAMPDFHEGVILYGLSPREAAKSKYFSEEEAALYSFFFLVRTKGETNALVPYEWIIGIEPDACIETVR